MGCYAWGAVLLWACCLDMTRPGIRFSFSVHFIASDSETTTTCIFLNPEDSMKNVL